MPANFSFSYEAGNFSFTVFLFLYFYLNKGTDIFLSFNGKENIYLQNPKVFYIFIYIYFFLMKIVSIYLSYDAVSILDLWEFCCMYLKIRKIKDS